MSVEGNAIWGIIYSWIITLQKKGLKRFSHTLGYLQV